MGERLHGEAYGVAIGTDVPGKPAAGGCGLSRPLLRSQPNPVGRMVSTPAKVKCSHGARARGGPEEFS